MFKKFLITLLALSLLMGTMVALPGMAATDAEESLKYGDMETISSEVPNLPEGITLGEGNTEGATISVETNKANVRSGEASLKVSNAGDTDVASFTITNTLLRDKEETRDTYYYLEAFFKVEGDATLSGSGVSCVWTYRGSGSTPVQSAKFTKANDGRGGWQKLMVSVAIPSAYDQIVTLKLEGAGTVYFDDITIRPHEGFINGDFSGRWGDARVPSVWKNTVTHASVLPKVWENADFDATTYMGFRYDPTTQEHYAEAKGARFNSTSSKGNTFPLGQSFSVRNQGGTYKVEFDYTDGDTATNNIAPIGFLCTQQNDTNYRAAATALYCNNLTENQDTWHHAELYMIMDSTASTEVLHWNIIMAANSGVTKLKNITMEEVTLDSGIRNANGEEVTVLKNNEKVKTWFAAPEAFANYNAETCKEYLVFSGLYKKEGTALKLEECYIDTAQAKNVFQGQYGNVATGSAPAGHIPAMAEREITVPATGDYVIKTMVLDSIDSLKPILNAASAETKTE